MWSFISFLNISDYCEFAALIVAIDSSGKLVIVLVKKENGIKKKFLKLIEVIAWIRSTPEAYQGNEAYTRLLTRSTLRRAAQTHVESLISIIGNQNRGQDWEKILTEIQFRTIGPSFHECGSLLIELIRILSRNSSIGALLKTLEMRTRRNPNIIVSPFVNL